MNKIKLLVFIIFILGILWLLSVLVSNLNQDNVLIPESIEDKGEYKEVTVFGNYTNTSVIMKVKYPNNKEVYTFFIEYDSFDFDIIDSRLEDIKNDFLVYMRSFSYRK